MFGIDKDKIKVAFAEFESDLFVLAKSPDPVVNLLVKFVLALKAAFS